MIEKPSDLYKKALKETAAINEADIEERKFTLTEKIILKPVFKIIKLRLVMAFKKYDKQLGKYVKEKNELRIKRLERQMREKCITAINEMNRYFDITNDEGKPINSNDLELYSTEQLIQLLKKLLSELEVLL